MVLHQQEGVLEPDPDRPRQIQSSSDRVLAQNSSESIDSLDLHEATRRPVKYIGDRDLEIDPAVRPSCVVVLDELGENPLEMALVSDEQPVEAFPTRGANESFGESVRQSRQLHLMETVRPEPSE